MGWRGAGGNEDMWGGGREGGVGTVEATGDGIVVFDDALVDVHAVCAGAGVDLDGVEG